MTHRAQILIAGGSGLIGRRLSQRLEKKGFEVAWLTRRKTASCRSFLWNFPAGHLDPQAIEFADYLINLSGQNISESRWTSKIKKEILDSRVQSTLFLYRQVQQSGKKLKGFISASATGYYGSITGRRTYSENDPPGNDFLASVCRQWEQAAQQFIHLDTRVVFLRTGIVLSLCGGMLPKVTLPMRLGLGAALGSGRQFMPWIHINDLCDIYTLAIENPQMQGAYNAVAPEQVTMQRFFQTLAQVLRRPYWLPNVPSLLLKVVLGEMSKLLLEGSPISPKRIMEDGYFYQFPDLQSCLIDLLHKP